MESENASLPEQHEVEPTSKIILHFMRHSDKEKNADKSDAEQALTPKGRKMAKEKALKTNLKQAVAFGSPRQRTQETAGLVMAGSEDEITGNETFEELKDKLDAGLKVGKKIGADERLNFGEDASTEYYKVMLDHFKKGNLLDFLVNESDELAKKYDDKKTFTYSRSAKEIG